MLRAIQEIKPTFVIAENVFGITNIDGGLVFQQVCLDLEAEGYEVQPFIIPAAAKNAVHRRDRCWFIATNSKSEGSGGLLIGKEKKNTINGINGSNGNVTNTYSSNNKTQSQKRILGQENQGRKTRGFVNGDSRTQWNEFPTQSPICGGDDGLPTKLDGITFSKWRAESIKGYGNAIVPQIALQLFQILETL